MNAGAGPGSPWRLALGWCLGTALLAALGLWGALATPQAWAGEPPANATGVRTLAPSAASPAPVTVFYPTHETARPVTRGPFHLVLAPDAAPARGNGRLVLISHGSGGSAWPQAALAQLLVARGFTVALPEHAGDNWHDMSDLGPVSWMRRPRELSQAIDAVAADARLAPLLLLDRVGVYGMSAGGLAALTLAGARWSPARLAAHCDAHLEDDFAGCAGLATELTGGPLDALRLGMARVLIRQRLGGDDAPRQWHDPRVAAVVAAVPMATPVDPASLARPVVPLGLVRAGRDAWLPPRWHVDAIRAACAGCVLVADLPEAGHGSILSPQVPGLSGRAARMLADPAGFDRAGVEAANAAIARFFVQNLAP